MKRFLKNILIFSILVLMLLIIGEIIVRHLPSSYSTKDKSLRSRGDQISTLILGSSHTYYGLMPEAMGDSVFNLANISQSPEYDYALVEFYKDSLPNLKQLIIPISYFTYRDPAIENGDEWTLAVKYKIGMHLPLHSDFSIYNLEMTDFAGYTGQLANLVLRKPSNISAPDGFGLGYGLDRKSSDWSEKGLERVAKHSLKTPGRFNEVLSVQKKLLDLAEKNGWKVTLITTPTYKGYYENLDSVQEKEMREGIEILKRDYDFDYYDFLRDPRFNDDDFYDVDHLSDIGARKFSKLLSDTLKNSVNP